MDGDCSLHSISSVTPPHPPSAPTTTLIFRQKFRNIAATSEPSNAIKSGSLRTAKAACRCLSPPHHPLLPPAERLQMRLHPVHVSAAWGEEERSPGQGRAHGSLHIAPLCVRETARAAGEEALVQTPSPAAVRTAFRNTERERERQRERERDRDRDRSVEKEIWSLSLAQCCPAPPPPW